MCESSEVELGLVRPDPKIDVLIEDSEREFDACDGKMSSIMLIHKRPNLILSLPYAVNFSRKM